MRLLRPASFGYILSEGEQQVAAVVQVTLAFRRTLREEIVRQFGALKKHRREQIYDVSGNHDRSGLDEPQAWWRRKWIDPTGEHTEFSHVDAAKRPFRIEGTWERYSFRAGNLLFLMMSDINEQPKKPLCAPTYNLRDPLIA